METNNDLDLKKKELFRNGTTVLLLLAVFTFGEFGLSATGSDWITIFFLIALFKAFFVMRDYMHIGRLFSQGEEE